MRPFLGRFGRIIDVKNSNSVYVADTGNNIRRIAQIAHYLDTEGYSKNRREMQEINEKHKIARTKSKSFYEILTKNESIFILIFFLMGSIIGFGTRGYMMKKIEGGW
jgi:general secretion pathway protein D